MKPLTDAAIRIQGSSSTRCRSSAEADRCSRRFVRVDAAPVVSLWQSGSARSSLRVDVCFELDRAAGDNVILRAWADLCGFDISPRNVDERIAGDI